MSLFLATLLPGIVLTILGILFFSNHSAFKVMLKNFPRSQLATYILFGGSAVWFLWIISHLGEADFGDYRTWLVLGFGAVALLSFHYVPDFLAVRGLSVFILLAAHPLLQAAFMEYDFPSRLFMVSFIYLAIVFALIMGVMPYRLRDLIQWLLFSANRLKTFGAGFLVYGILLIVVAFRY